MSIETEIKVFNGIFERYLKIEEEKTAAISKLANAIISAGKVPQAIAVRAASEPLLNEAEKPVVSPTHAQASDVPVPTHAQASEAPVPTEKEEAPVEDSAPAEKTEEAMAAAGVTPEMDKKASDIIRELCNKLAGKIGVGGRQKVIDLIKTLGHGGDAKVLPYEVKLQLIELVTNKLASLEASHA